VRDEPDRCGPDESRVVVAKGYGRLEDHLEVSSVSKPSENSQPHGNPVRLVTLPTEDTHTTSLESSMRDRKFLSFRKREKVPGTELPTYATADSLATHPTHRMSDERGVNRQQFSSSVPGTFTGAWHVYVYNRRR